MAAVEHHLRGNNGRLLASINRMPCGVRGHSHDDERRAVRDRIIALLTAIDEALAANAAGRTLEVYHIGRSALVWEYDYIATTADIDILQPKGGKELVEV